MMSSKRLQEIRDELKTVDQWFCSDWIKHMAQDMLTEIDALQKELEITKRRMYAAQDAFMEKVNNE